MNKQSRWKSYVLWSAIVAQVISLGQLLGIFEKLGIDAGQAGNAVAAMLQVLVVLGVINNPTDGGAL